MPAHFATETELRQWLAKSSVPLHEIPRGAGRNQSKLHTELVKSCYEWLRLKGIFCWRNNVGAVRIGKRLVRFGLVGMPDILFVVNGRFGGLEMKTGSGQQRPEQRAMQLEFERVNALYLVVRNLDDLEKWFA